MSDPALSRLLHDLRAPLARAKTLAKLLGETPPEELPGEIVALIDALDELDRRMRVFESDAEE